MCAKNCQIWLMRFYSIKQKNVRWPRFLDHAVLHAKIDITSHKLKIPGNPNPGAPVAPRPPGAPVWPIWPGLPGLPGLPGDPLEPGPPKPRWPVAPVNPCRPTTPVAPGDPTRPGVPAHKMSQYTLQFVNHFTVSIGNAFDSNSTVNLLPDPPFLSTARSF